MYGLKTANFSVSSLHFSKCLVVARMHRKRGNKIFSYSVTHPFYFNRRDIILPEMAHWKDKGEKISSLPSLFHHIENRINCL